jgi:hypothetical protein
LIGCGGCDVGVAESADALAAGRDGAGHDGAGHDDAGHDRAAVERHAPGAGRHPTRLDTCPL